MAEESSDAKCLCSKTWVLVVHNDFLQIEGYERHGNDVDLENLRRVFQVERRCRFAELKNCDKEEILGTLSSEQKLIKMFHPDDDYDEIISAPKILYLFVLSHGESRGRILTDHLKIKPSNFVLALETYNTSDIWNYLSDLNFLKSCTKIICLAPCRGINPETKIDPEDDFIKQEGDKIVLPGWLTSNPNREDFIIFYATVENTYANRNELRGTWFVQSICSVLDNISRGLDILMFFTRVQFQVCQMTKIAHADVGQTPQLHFFCNKNFDVCARHCELICRTKNMQLKVKNVDLSDCRRMSYHDDVVDEQNDAKGFNLHNLLENERVLFYNWRHQHFNFSRGIALIFHDDQHVNHLLELANCFRGLDYKVKLGAVKKINNSITQNSLKRKFVSEGSLVVCILAQLVETDAGMALLNGGDCILLSAIVDEFSGPKCKHLIGKPKLFFFLDEGNKQDSTVPSQIYDAHQFNNSHAGVSVFIGVGASLIEGLCLKLNSEELCISGSKSLQAALVDLIRSTDSMPPDRMCIIKPQIISTLPVLVDFPQLKAIKKKILYLSGSIDLAVCMTFCIAMFFFINSFFINLDDLNNKAWHDMFDVDLQSNCSINFLPKNTSTMEAFSMQRNEWSNLSKICTQHWKVFIPENAIAKLIVAGNVSQAVLKFKDASKEEHQRSATQQLKLVVLFAYDYYLSTMGKFCVELNKLNLGEQCFYDIYKRISKFCGIAHVEVLDFWYYYLQHKHLPFSALHYYNNSDLDKLYWEDSDIGAIQYHFKLQVNCLEADNYNLPINSSDSVLKIFALINYEIRSRKNYFYFFNQFMKLEEDIKKFYLPLLASRYYDKGFNLKHLIDVLKFDKLGFLACCAISKLFERLKNDGKLQSTETLQLKVASYRVLQDGNVISENGDEHGDEIHLCAYVIQELVDMQIEN